MLFNWAILATRDYKGPQLGLSGEAEARAILNAMTRAKDERLSNIQLILNDLEVVEAITGRLGGRS